jgi:putative NADH-flavin reductase
MKIALLGATGFVGSALLKEALDRGHTVTAIVRHPEKIVPRDRLIATSGDVYDSSALAKLIAGHDATKCSSSSCWEE